MKKFRRVLSALMLFCMVLTLLPPVQFARAATAYRYELDKDGIDAGAVYLIVNTATNGTAHALRFTGNGNKYGDQTLTVASENGITYIAPGFTSESACQFKFSDTSSGRVQTADGTGILDLSKTNNQFASSSTRTMRFTNAGNGAYRIYYNSRYYLRYSNSSWARNSSSANVYLFKLVEYEVGYNITFDGNGNTSGTLPQDVTSLEPGATYTFPEPDKNLRKDIGEDTWLFQYWGTKADGSGQHYHPGDTITVTEDLTLYVNWYQQTKYSASMITYLDGTKTDVDVISGLDKHFYAKLEGSDTYIPLNKTADGTYTAKVTENGTYIIYSKVGNGDYEAVHGHKVVIYNQDGYTECIHYSVTYDVNGGAWAAGEAHNSEICHNGETVVAYDKTPVKDGYTFLYWQDAEGNLYAPGQTVTTAADKPIALTAQWQKNITVTVNFVINHNALTGGVDNSDKAQELRYVLMRVENGVNVPVGEEVVLNGGEPDEQGNTVYTVTYENMPQGVYRVATLKSNYECQITYGGGAEEDQTISVNLVYQPTNFDATFAVKVHAAEGEEELMPDAVNIKVSYWGYNSKNELGWHIITQQSGNSAPVTVLIDENGEGYGFYPVWKTWSDSNYAYEYRVEVTSFVMPDGSIVAASGDLVTYKANGSGLYKATVSVADGGRAPEGSDYSGVYYDGTAQNGTITVDVEINPLTVKFDAGEGTVNGQQSITLENQYQHPDLNNYIAVPNDETKVFLGWMVDDKVVANAAGQLLAGNVTYTASYSTNITISGTINVDKTYQDNGQTVQIIGNDRVDELLVILQKKVDNVYNDVDTFVTKVTYADDKASGEAYYEFQNLPNDGSQYRVQAVVPNYNTEYNNNQDEIFSADEALAQINEQTSSGEVDIHLMFAPESYLQSVRVDATQINENMRPTDALVQVLYRDLNNVHVYTTISQHTVAPYGIEIPMDYMSHGSGSEEVWVRHTNGALYEYQAQLYKLYGNVENAYEMEGTEYSSDSPYTVEYGAPGSYLNMNDGDLTVTLVPKTYQVILDMNLDGDEDAVIRGMDQFMVDDGSGNITYAYTHTWSYADDFVAYPYREGWVFLGWEENEDNELIVDAVGGEVHVGAALARNVTLTALWDELEGTDYTVRHLEMNTNKVLYGAQMISGAAEGDQIMAATAAVSIKGYKYVGANIGGTFYHSSDNPALTVTTDPINNLITIYYLPDGSDGYTEQVESNIEINKEAVLEKDGTYTITMDTFTKDSPITTQVLNNLPLDIVLVLDQSGSMAYSGAVNDLREAAENFITLLANHGNQNAIDHRIAIVGYASDEDSGGIKYTTSYPVAGKDGAYWYNTGVFDSHGKFHAYSFKGFNYTLYTGNVAPGLTQTVNNQKQEIAFYTKADDEYLLLTYHEVYYHLVTEAEAREAVISGEPVYGRVDGLFVELERNSSGLWLYGDKKLYSDVDLYTYHTDVWTHREGLERREIHAYGTNENFTEVGDHQGVYTRTEVRENFQQSIYKDALVPVTVGANGAGSVTPGLLKATENIGANGQTHVSYGMEMANNIFEANPIENTNRQRVVIVFTDGKPGDGSNFDDDEANRALEYSKIAEEKYNADVYTVGMYGNDVVAAESDQDYFMNGLSSNYPTADSMDDVWQGITYKAVEEAQISVNAGGPYFVLVGGKYRKLTLTTPLRYSGGVYYMGWAYVDDNGNRVTVAETPSPNHPVITSGQLGGYTIYRRYGAGYQQATNSGYYTVAKSSAELTQYFADVLHRITTNINSVVVLEENTILRDIMGQGLVLTEDTVITAYRQAGRYDDATGNIIRETDNNGDPVYQPDPVILKVGDGKTDVKGDNGITISVYNLDAENATAPNEANYHPHTIDVTGYNYSDWFISEKHPNGFKLVITVDNIEAKDNVRWGVSTSTNHEQSGLWLPEAEGRERQLLMAFEQPTTIFVERAYVLDYGKEFTLSGWYFDDEDGKDATPVHLDLDTTDGMNGFETPVTANTVDGPTGNTKYGNVKIENGSIKYTPTTMNWGGYDQFYVFGQTWRKTVLAQTANKNGVPEDDGLANLWNKVTVIPANNIYYEDSFITKDGGTQNGIEGFTFGEGWTVVGSEDGNVENPEHPEHMESNPYGNVHGWTDSLADDTTFTDGAAHVTGLKGEMGARAEFTFTGTGVEVYTRTNAKSGTVVAILSRKTVDAEGKETTVLHKSLAVDNLAMSGDYYHIPTVAFNKLPYGTYTLQLIATAATSPETGKRYEYYIDGVRVINPLGNEANYQSGVVRDAYELETNAVFTEVRDILLDNGSFSADRDDIEGAVFIDWIKDGQGTGSDEVGTKKPTYEIGTFEAYGPKNEVYLAAGQAIVLKVEEGNHYFVGLKSLKGTPVTANLNDIEGEEPTTIQLTHTTDMYYRVTPVNGYIVIQNGSADESILSITNLRTTNLKSPAENGGVLRLAKAEAIEVAEEFTELLMEVQSRPPEPQEPEETLPSAQDRAESNLQTANVLFTAVRQWLETE